LDNKKKQDDVRGFEEFIDAEADKTFLGKPQGSKRETSFESFTFLSNDGERLMRIKNLLSEKLPFVSKYEQGENLLERQKEEIEELREKIFTVSDQKNSPYRKSLGEIFDSFFRATDS
jgi:hypothetical protein